MHEYEMAVLGALKAGRTLDFDEILRETGINKDSLFWALENLSKEGMVNVERINKDEMEISDEGRDYAESEMPEMLLARRIGKGKIEIGKISEQRERIGLQWAKAKGLITIGNGTVELTQKGREGIGKESVEKIVLGKIARGDIGAAGIERSEKEALENLVKRKLVSIRKKTIIGNISITDAGMKASTTANGEIDRVNRKMIMDRSWVGKSFKKYDVKVGVEEAQAAKMHPLRETINNVKDAYLGMGFTEISGPIVEPSFWVHDTLFIPQDHPARDVQDTFYLENPERMTVRNRDIMRAVSREHERAWRDEWRTDVAERAMLRTHMTSVSARFLYDLKDYKEYELPIKIFSVGRVFRNESIDYRHLADFYQTDGMIIGNGLTLANLFDTLTKIFGSLGFGVRFMPTYFPFVEPGVEVQAYYKEKKEWLELGGAGVLRNEIVKAAGKKASVLAWGLGIERMLLMKDSRIKTISELYNNGVGWSRKM